MIKYESHQQLPIKEFALPFGGQLSPDNRWVLLGHHLPWDELVSIYSKQMSTDMGRAAISPRIAIGALIIKHMKKLSDEATVAEIRENPYLQYFLGYTTYSYHQPFTPSLLVSFRRRLGANAFNDLSERFIEYVRKIETESRNTTQKHTKQPAENEDSDNDSEGGGGNKGHLIVDATVSPADIKYPTDLDLLNESRQKSEELIDLLYVPQEGKVKPRTYRQIAQKQYLSVAKVKKKSKKKLNKAISQQLRYLRRNFKTIEHLLNEQGSDTFPLNSKHQRLYWIIQEVYRQQKDMYDSKRHHTPHRIVSISQPHVRPIIRGKAGKDVEFGAKVSVSLVNGFSYVHKIAWDAYNESSDLRRQIESYYDQFGYYPEWVSADKIYGTRENRQYMKARHIKFTGAPLGRPKSMTSALKVEHKKRRRIHQKRSCIEGKFGEGKRKYDLDVIKARTSETSMSWIGAVFFVMNIAHWLRVIFLSILNLGILGQNAGIKSIWRLNYFRMGHKLVVYHTTF